MRVSGDDIINAPGKKASENEVKRFFEDFASRAGWQVWREVRMTTPAGEGIRIDYVVGTLLPTKTLAYFGVEAKRLADGCRHSSDAIRQCVSYQGATLTDPRLAEEPIPDRRLPFVFLLSPDTLRLTGNPDHTTSTPDYWFGAVRVAAALNIGTIRQDMFDGVSLNAVEQLWSERKGVRKAALVTTPFVSVGN